MGNMYKNRKQAGGHGPPRENTDTQKHEMDLRKIMKDVENFSYSHMTWKERKKIENRNVVSLGGKPPKNQRLPLSVARPMMKKQQEREQNRKVGFVHHFDMFLFGLLICRVYSPGYRHCLTQLIFTSVSVRPHGGRQMYLSDGHTKSSSSPKAERELRSNALVKGLVPAKGTPTLKSGQARISRIINEQ
uniref:Uncharacterized protein n=1 Tax=Cajanus cajan TaxID=3821 RepID=A0A151S344_CAJCA|nr:hypothetical protein KK1_028992 [Cajanus cajan]